MPKSPQQIAETLFKKHERQLLTDDELGWMLISQLALCRGFDVVAISVLRLQPEAREVAVAFARQVLDPSWTVVPWGAGAPPPTGEAYKDEVAALKQVARRVLEVVASA